jgi:hypothetical protein
MAIARRGSTNYSAEMYNNSSSVAITKESTVAVGDIIFIAVSSYGEGTGSGNGASVTGFTKIVDQDFNGSRASLLWRVVDGTEGSTFNVTIGGMEWRCAGVVLIAFSGTGLSIDTSNFTYNGASVTSLVAPSLTAAAANELLVNFFLYSDPGTFTAPSGADGSFANSPQNTNGAAVSWDAIASSGATGTRTATIGTARSALSVSVLLKETGASATSRPLIRSYQFAHLVGR